MPRLSQGRQAGADGEAWLVDDLEFHQTLRSVVGPRQYFSEYSGSTGDIGISGGELVTYDAVHVQASRSQPKGYFVGASDAHRPRSCRGQHSMKWLEHVGIIVSDLEVSIDFYSRLFGAPPVERVEWKGESAEYIARMVGKPGLELTGAFFRIPGTAALLEVICYSQSDDRTRRPLDPSEIGAVHIGFYVESVDDALQHLAAVGVTDIGTPVDLMHGPYKGGRAVYFRDPDGNNLQLMEVRGRPGAVPPPSPTP